jgi:hypothetical protein
VESNSKKPDDSSLSLLTVFHFISTSMFVPEIESQEAFLSPSTIMDRENSKGGLTLRRAKCGIALTFRGWRAPNVRSIALVSTYVKLFAFITPLLFL